MAKIALRCAEGVTNQQAAADLGIDRSGQRSPAKDSSTSLDY